MSTVTYRPIAPVRAEAIATKLASIHNLEYPELWEQINAQPRIVEMLWWLQYLSMQPGGLAKWSAEFLATNADRIGTATMHSARVVSGKYSLEQTRTILREVPTCVDFASFSWREQLRRPVSYNALLDETNGEIARERRIEFEEKLKKVSQSELLNACRSAAEVDLSHHLHAMCTDVAQGFSGKWYFRDLIEALFGAMDDHASRFKNGIAQTEVATKVFDALDYCLAIRKMVHISGDSRYGKSESIKSWCAAIPGRARVVVVPDSNSEGDLYNRVAEALGIDAGVATKLSELRTRIAYVLKHSKLMLVFDEGHYLWPTKFSKNTAPARLNWVRSILDNRTPIAICFTPQSFKRARNAFSQTTGYTVEQFAGRVMRTVTLPEVLSKKDLFAVAKHHGREFDDDFLQAIVAAARRSEGFLHAVEAITDLTRYKARQRNHSTPTADDLLEATNEVVPPIQKPASRHTDDEHASGGSRRIAKPIPERSDPFAEPSTGAPRGASIQLPADRTAQLEPVEA